MGAIYLIVICVGFVAPYKKAVKGNHQLIQFALSLTDIMQHSRFL